MSIFNTVATRQMRKNAFNLSHERKLSCNQGHLVPFMVQEILPNDSFRVNTEILMRLSPMVAPVMHRINLYTHYFYVPNRIVWDNFEKFISGEEGSFIHPYVEVTDANKAHFTKKSLADYMGIPVVDPATTVTQTTAINSLPFRAYQKIYNDFYRDQDLITEIPVPTGDGIDDPAVVCKMHRRSYEKDYFTSCRPDTQKGTQVGIPVEIQYDDVTTAKDSVSGNPPASDQNLKAQGSTGIVTDDGGLNFYKLENLDTEAMNVNIEDLRRSARIQEWLELAMRGGSRFTEHLRNFWGVKSPDSRLQRAEYLGGGKVPVTISEVLSTVTDSQVQDFPPQGNMSGHGITVGNSNRFKKRFLEHGFVIGILSILPRTAYSQSLHKQWRRFQTFDYYFRQFAHLGEQEVLHRELFNDYTTNVGTVFGYQSRFAEYKYMNSSVHGDMRDTLSHWTMDRKFATKPLLNQQFIECRNEDGPDDIFAVTDPTEDKFYLQLFNNVKAVRYMPYHNIPTL